MSKQPGYVYLFKNEFGLTKIGHAINPDNRARTIESSSGLAIVESYLSPVCFNHLEIEGLLKRQFAPYRKQGEWFDIDFETLKTALDSFFQEVVTPTPKPIIAIANHAISENQDEPAVNARELHAWLESKRDFSNWIKQRIAEYGFVEAHDYCSTKLLSNEYAGVQTRVEYFISLDMAKELSMVERTAKGKEARQYFIACEKALRQSKPTVVDSDLRNVIYTVVAQALEDFSRPKTPKRPRTEHLQYTNPKHANWGKLIEAWLLTISDDTEFTIQTVTKDVLGLHPNEVDQAAVFRVSRILSALGIHRFRVSTIQKGRRPYFYKRGVK